MTPSAIKVSALLAFLALSQSSVADPAAFKPVGDAAARAACALGYPGNTLLCLSQQTFTVCAQNAKDSTEKSVPQGKVCLQGDKKYSDWTYAGHVVTPSYYAIKIGPSFDYSQPMMPIVPEGDNIPEAAKKAGVKPDSQQGNTFWTSSVTSASVKNEAATTTNSINFEEGLTKTAAANFENVLSVSAAPSVTDSKVIASESAAALGAARASLASEEAKYSKVTGSPAFTFTEEPSKTVVTNVVTAARREATKVW